MQTVPRLVISAIRGGLGKDDNHVRYYRCLAEAGQAGCGF